MLSPTEIQDSDDYKMDPFTAVTLGMIEPIVQYLENGNDINIQDNEGRTLLQCSLLGDQFNDEIAAFLIKAGIDLSGLTSSHSEEQDSEYLNASVLHLAYLNGNSYSLAFNLLIDNPLINLNAVCDDGIKTWYDTTISNGGIPPRCYDDNDSFEETTILHYAVLQQDLQAVNKILSYKNRINVNAETRKVHNKELSKKYDSWLVENEINSEDEYQDYGLLYIAREAVEVYCIKKITPLHLACELNPGYGLGNSEIIEALLKAGANPNHLDGRKETPLKYLSDIQKMHVRRGSINKQDEISELISFLKCTTLQEKKYKSRLFLGESDFSYAQALVQKHQDRHPHLGRFLTATEYQPREVLVQTYPQSFVANERYLLAHHVNVQFSVNATQLHLDERFRDKLFTRIHFNFPHDKSNFRKRTLPKMIYGFFESASKCQEITDRIHITLPKPVTESKHIFYQGYVYGLFKAATENHYCLIKKRVFHGQRYPGYEHRITNRNQSAPVAESAREYIFTKTDLSYEEIVAQFPSKTREAYDECYQFFSKEPTTDYDSSDYECLSDNERGKLKGK